MHLPMRTAVFQATSLGIVSNLLAQLLAAARASSSSAPAPGLLLGWLDVPQLSRFILYTLATAPLNYYFQELLEFAFPGRRNSSSSSSNHRRRRPPIFHPKRSDDPEKHPRYKEKPFVPAGTWTPSSSSSSSSAGSLDWPNTMIKLFLDAISLGTFVNTAAFLGIMGFLKGQSCRQIIYNIQTQLAPIVFAGYRVWPLASFISFTCVPLERRIAWNSLVGLFWGIYMSMIAETV